MKAPPLTSKELQQLNQACRSAAVELRDFREQRTQTIRAFAGYRYGPNAIRRKQPMNLLDMFVTTYSHQLTPENPRLLVQSDVAGLKPDSKKIQLAVARWTQVRKFSRTVQGVVRDALFGMGVVMVGEEPDDGTDKYERDEKEMGCIYTDHVQTDDYGWDVAARSWGEVCFEWNEFSCDYDELMASDYYDKEAKDMLQPSENWLKDQLGTERAASLSRSESVIRDGYRRLVNNVNVYLPMDKLIFTFPRDGNWEYPLHWAEWNGPDRGPYHKLFFGTVPANLVPKNFAAELYDLHDAYNRLLNKCVRSAEREKRIPVISPGSEDDATRLEKASDGQATKITSGAIIQEAGFGGVSSTSMAFVLSLAELFNRRAGNLDLLAGLGPQSPTLGQDELISKSASAQIKAMSNDVQTFVSNVLTDVANYLYHDPSLEIPLIYKAQGYEKVQYTHTWTPEERRGDFLAYNFRLDPYSSQSHTPSEQLQIVMQYVSQTLIPLAPMMQAQGVSINLRALNDIFTEMTNVGLLSDILTYNNPAPPDTEAKAIGEAPKAAYTHRINERISRPSATSSDKLGTIAQALLAGGGDKRQPKEMAGLMR